MQAVASQIHLTMVESKERKAAFLLVKSHEILNSQLLLPIWFEDVVSLAERRSDRRCHRPSCSAERNGLRRCFGFVVAVRSPPHFSEPPALREDIGGFRLRGITSPLTSRQTPFSRRYSLS